MKSISTFLTINLLAIVLLSGRMEAQTVSIPDITATSGSTVLVPINFTGLDYVGAISLFVLYDPNVLTFIEITNLSPEALGTLANAMTNPDQIGISWLAPGVTGVDHPDGKFLDMKFTFNGGYTDLDFASYCEIVDWDVNVINVVYTNGSVAAPAVTFNLTAFIEGAYQTGSGGMMNTDLLDSGILPQDQPFGPALPYYGNPNPQWYYTGTENIGVLPANVVDWVIVELRDAPTAALATPATAVARKPLLLLSNGSIRELDGTSIPTFYVSINSGAFAVVMHRNHLSIMNANPISGFLNSYAYNFSTGSNQVYGGSVAHNMLETGVWGMISGDINADQIVNGQDKNDGWMPEAAKAGYLGSDINLDLQVSNNDKNQYLINNLGKQSMVP
jgi:hypothetical protein